jgi:hypothetical protein
VLQAEVGARRRDGPSRDDSGPRRASSSGVAPGARMGEAARLVTLGAGVCSRARVGCKALLAFLLLCSGRRSSCWRRDG